MLHIPHYPTLVFNRCGHSQGRPINRWRWRQLKHAGVLCPGISSWSRHIGLAKCHCLYVSSSCRGWQLAAETCIHHWRDHHAPKLSALLPSPIFTAQFLKFNILWWCTKEIDWENLSKVAPASWTVSYHMPCNLLQATNTLMVAARVQVSDAISTCMFVASSTASVKDVGFVSKTCDNGIVSSSVPNSAGSIPMTDRMLLKSVSSPAFIRVHVRRASRS